VEHSAEREADRPAGTGRARQAQDEAVEVDHRPAARDRRRGHLAPGSQRNLLVGAFTTLVITLLLFGVDVSQLVLGGAITTVFLSIAAQQALGNVFAGLVLVFARPFKVGDEIRLQAGALGGPLDGIVTDIGITYVRFDTDGSVMSIPNSQVLNAVVGPVPPEPEDGEDPEVAADGKSGTPGGPEQPQPRPPGPA